MPAPWQNGFEIARLDTGILNIVAWSYSNRQMGLLDELDDLQLLYGRMDNLLSRFLQWSGLLSHLRSYERYDEPETLPFSIRAFCPMSADGDMHGTSGGDSATSQDLAADLSSPGSSHVRQPTNHKHKVDARSTHRSLGYLSVSRYAIRSVRCCGSGSPANGITLPGNAFCGAVMKASRDFSSQTIFEVFMAWL